MDSKTRAALVEKYRFEGKTYSARRALQDAVDDAMKRMFFDDEGDYVVTVHKVADRAVPEPDADAIERAAKAITSIWNKPSPNPTAFPASAETLARAALATTGDAPGLDAVYRERNQVVAALSKCFYSWIGTVDDAEPGWTKAVYIDLPSGQVSWHVPDHEIPDLFGHLQESGEPWDGHTTEEKYERLAALAAVPTEQDAAGDDLDAMLDSVHPGCYISYVLEEGNHWRCYIRWPASVGKRSNPYPHRDAMGTGPTRIAAIQDAVANARKEATP